MRDRRIEKNYNQVTDRISALLEERGSLNVAIDGNSGAGKTTLAEYLYEKYYCNVFHMDDFFLRPELRTDKRLEEVGGNVDYLRFYEEVIKGLKSGEVFSYRPFDCKIMTLKKSVRVEPKELNIIEGVYSMHPSLINNYDLKIFMEVDKKDQSYRILKRNGPIMHRRFINEWIPLENKYFKETGIRKKCHIVIKG